MPVFRTKQSTRELRQVGRNKSRNIWRCWWWWRWGSFLMGAIVVVIFMTEWVWGRSHLDLNKFNQMHFGTDAKTADIMQSSSFIPPFSDRTVPHASFIVKNTTSLSSEVPGEVKTKARTTTTVSGISQKHVVDCHSIVGDTVNENVDPGGGLFVKTKTEPSFWMNIHQPSKDIVSTMIQRDGCFECDYIKDVQNVLRSHPTAYFLDIGTNIGMWTLSIAAMGYDTYSLEPFPQNWNRACRSIKRNPELFKNHVTLLNVAATGNDAMLHLVDAATKNLGGVKIQPILPKSNTVITAASEGNMNSKLVVATGIRLDSLKLPRDRPVVIKLDVEGNEVDAMLGGFDFLNHANIVYFFMEVWTKNLRQKSAQIKNIGKILSAKGLLPYRYDFDEHLNRTVEVRVVVQPKHPVTWKPHPRSKYFDVVWRLQPRNATGTDDSFVN